MIVDGMRVAPRPSSSLTSRSAKRCIRAFARWRSFSSKSIHPTEGKRIPTFAVVTKNEVHEALGAPRSRVRAPCPN